MSISHLKELTHQVRRIEHCGMHVDLVETSQGIVRVGGMPDIGKFLMEHGIQESTVVVPDWTVSLAGDNRTGEEFILWLAQSQDSPLKEYVGQKRNVEQLHHHLGRIFPYFFDDERLSIVKKDWMDKWFHPNIAAPCYSCGDLEIRCEAGNILVSDKGNVVYDRNALAPTECVDDAIEALLATIPRDNAIRDSLEVIPIGCGNGFYGTVANVLVRFDKYVLWIDPCGYPAHALARHGIHWDDVTHFLFTHNHEDHVQGFTACLHRARKYGRKLNLLAADSVFQLMAELYAPLFPDLTEHVSVHSLTPGTPLRLGPLTIESRWNHHILPYGSIGLRISAGEHSFGYSGDTKYDEALNAILKREELTARWFAPCDLVFHEINFDNPGSVHTHWKQVESLQKELSGKVLGYHTSFKENSPIPLAKEGYRYIIANNYI